ncbi:hypothetical protein MKEN_01277600 [Mycena kentingensis (nom. inval.)]|nr:hypothetical protein MKEN_01277600 [Mycena kentingensis (nom. inval.)]
MALSRLARTRILASTSVPPLLLAQAHAFWVYLPIRPPAHWHVVYTPDPYGLLAMCGVQVLLQGWWIWGMFARPGGAGFGVLDRRQRRRRRVRADVEAGGEEEEQVSVSVQEIDDNAEPTLLAYGPVYALCNVLFAGGVLAWSFSIPTLSHVLIFLTTAIQLYFVFGVLPAEKYVLRRRNRITHTVVKMNAGFMVAYAARAWAYIGIGMSRPIAQQQMFCGIIFLLLTVASGPEPTMGIALILTIGTLASGNPEERWRIAFAVIFGIMFVVIALDQIVAWRDRHTQPIVLGGGDGAGAGVGMEMEAYHDVDADEEENIYLSDVRTPSPSPTEVEFPRQGEEQETRKESSEEVGLLPV